MSHLLSPLLPLELQFMWRLLAAVVLGSCMGLERSISGKHAGMRTYALVALGSAAFVIISTLSSFELSIFAGINPLQIAASVVIGIGFIGSGLAIYRGEHLQPELTTASGLWVAAAVGMACGFGFYVIAVTATILTLVVLALLAKVEKKLRIRWGVEQKD